MFARLGRTASLAVAFIAFGFIFIFVGWYGASGWACVDCQIPYLISGGIAGLALVGLGSALLIFEAGRRAVGRLEEKLEHLANNVGAGTSADPATPVPLPETIATNGLVVIGRSSFHRPDCRLVEGKEDQQYGQTADAVQRGLQACRVCDPLGEYATAQATEEAPTRARSRRRDTASKR